MKHISYYIEKAKVDKKGLVAIIAQVTINYKDHRVQVAKVKPRYWNSSRQRVDKNREHEPDNDHIRINEKLKTLQKGLNVYLNDLERKYIPITKENVKKYLMGQNPVTVQKQTISFWQAYEEFLSLGEIEKADNTNRNRKTIKNKLVQFEAETGYTMTFETINMSFFDKLKEYILDTKEHDYNYLSAIVDKFKAFMTWSHEREYHSNLTYKKISAPEKEISIVHLTFEELQKLIYYPFQSQKHQQTRDFFCFGCLCGLRYCDLQRLTKDNYDGNYIKITTQKTNKEVVIPVWPLLKTIIDRYPDQHRLLPKYSNQKLNDYLKEICKLAEINTMVEYKRFVKNKTITEYRPKHDLIGTHTARKTFITLAYDRGMDIETIKDITGITREKTLRRYLLHNNETKREKLINAFGGL